MKILRRLGRACVACLVILPALPAGAAGPLARALEGAWERSVVAREAQGQADKARAERVASSSPWAHPPSVELAHRTDRWNGDAGSRENEVALAWPLWLPGQRDARGAAADAGLAAAEVSTDAARLRLAGEVRESAWALVARRAELAQAEEHARTLHTLADDVDRRVREGDLARADALAARAEWLGATAAESAARQQWRAAATAWRTLTGVPEVEAPDEPAAAAPAGWLDTHPDMRAASIAAEHARRRHEVARASRLDAPELRLGWRREEDARGEPARRSVQLGVRVPFGTADRNEPLLAATLADRDVAQATERRARIRLEADEAGARDAREAADAQAQAARTRATLLRERARLVDRAFRAGESALPDLLRALSAASQAEAALARQEAELGLARARHRQALGLLP